MRYLVPALFLVVLAQPTELQAQASNLVKNADFSSATIAPWVASGPALSPGLEKFNTSGTGNNVAYALNPGGTSPYPPHVLSQPNMLMLPIDYELSFDFATWVPQFSLTPTLPLVEAFVGTQRVLSVGTATRGTSPRRQRVCVRFRSTTTGVATLRLEISWRSVARANFTPRVYIDNVRLWPAVSPVFCIRGERRLGTSVKFDISGSPGSGFVMFVAAGLSAKPLSFPGITGLFRLNLLSTMQMFVGATNTKGEFTVTLQLPRVPGLGGVPLFWQGLEFTTKGVALGESSLQGFYD